MTAEQSLERWCRRAWHGMHEGWQPYPYTDDRVQYMVLYPRPSYSGYTGYTPVRSRASIPICFEVACRRIRTFDIPATIAPPSPWSDHPTTIISNPRCHRNTALAILDGPSEVDNTHLSAGGNGFDIVCADPRTDRDP